jgi:glyoxylase-like metal-dependent hydrolase (beta-lactamase superfamily II)
VQIDKRIYVAGSGRAGYNLTDPYDCDVYLVDCGASLVMIDTGAGMHPEQIAEVIRSHGFALTDISAILLTHAHGDHVGGAAWFSAAARAPLYAAPECAAYLAQGDAQKMSVDTAAARGLYPADFRVQPCAARPLADGETLRVGEACFTAVFTPGHCSGHHAYLLETPQKRYLFSGDSIFLGGRISLQNIWDCSISAYAQTARRLNALQFDALLPSHFGIDLQEGKKHVEKAVRWFEALDIPPQASAART